MASSSEAFDISRIQSTVRQVRTREDLAQLLMRVRQKEEVLKGLQRKLAIRETRVREAEKKLKKRSDFLDAWEVSLKSKEAELMEERREIENIKKNLRKIGEDLLSLSDKADSILEDIPYEEGILEEIPLEEEPREKRSFFGFLRGRTKKPPELFESKSKSIDSVPSTRKSRTLREVLEEKREKLKTSLPEESLQQRGIEEEEIFACPVCGAEVSEEDESCEGCGVELNWET